MIDNITISQKYNLTKDAVLLIDNGDHKIYWVGTTSEKALRSNIYLIKDKSEALIVDCGSRAEFQDTINRIEKVVPLSNVTRIFANHQDPDVTSSLIDWLEINPDIQIIASPNTNILISHYIPDHKSYNFYNTEKNPKLILSSGAVLEFIPSPFMHSPGAVSIYNYATKTLFSGDIWAALSLEWKLILDTDFNNHIEYMNFFHENYIGSNKIARNFLFKIKDKDITSIMPQHGSIITKDNVVKALNYLKHLKCGSDFYKDISDDELQFD